MKRRELIKSGLCVLGAYSFISQINLKKVLANRQAQLRRLSILQGATSDTETQISICLPKETEIRVFALDQNQNKIVPFQFTQHKEVFSNDKFLTYFFNNLSTESDYNLFVVNLSGVILDQRFFKTLKTQKNQFKAVVASCAHDRHPEIQEKMWKAVEQSETDVIFFIGDTVYVDSFEDGEVLSEAHMWKRYTHYRKLLYLYKMPRLIPVFATWDDHDTGTNNGNMNSPFMVEARKIFNIAFPSYNNKILQRTFGVASHLKIFNLNILMMDNRSYRTLKRDPEATHWGKAQENYVENVLQSATKPVWFMNGSQFFGAYRGSGHESYEWSHEKSFTWFKTLLKQSPKPALLTSGDIHYSELQRIEPEVCGYPVYEVTSSSIHSREKPKLFIENNIKNRRLALENKFNFVLFDFDVFSNSMNVEVQSIGQNYKIYFKKNFLVSK